MSTRAGSNYPALRTCVSVLRAHGLRRLHVAVPWALLCAVLCGPPSAARAQEGACNGTGLELEDELRVLPRDGAEQVALDAPITVAYGPDVDVDALARGLAADDVCTGAIVCLLASGSEAPRPVPSELRRLDAHTLVLDPRAQLRPDREYLVLVARPGFDRPTRMELGFTTGEAPDREPPEFSPALGALDLLVEPPPEPCDAPRGSLRVRLTPPAPTDDGEPTSLEVLAYLTRAEGLLAPELRARAAPRTADQDYVELTLLLSPEEAASSVCIALRAVDGVGKLSLGERELCFDPSAAEHSQFVSMCSAYLRPGRASLSRDWALLALLPSTAAILLVSRGERRRRRAAQHLRRAPE